jgi:hypothetical protein
MLIGLDRKFIFIANLKTASSAIEQTLKPLSEISITEAPFDKHMPFSSIEYLFSWTFDVIPRQQFMIFGVMRNPVDFVLSLYNSHTHKSFRIVFPHIYTGGMNFDRFLAEWCEKNREQLVPQYTRFLDRNGAIAANFVIAYDQLPKGLRHVASCIGAPQLLRMPMVNVSNRRLRRGDLTKQQFAWISQHFADDERFLARFANRLLTPADQASWQPAPAATQPLAVPQPNVQHAAM